VFRTPGAPWFEVRTTGWVSQSFVRENEIPIKQDDLLARRFKLRERTHATRVLGRRGKPQGKLA
jgi:hypothetical protein